MVCVISSIARMFMGLQVDGGKPVEAFQPCERESNMYVYASSIVTF